MPRDAVYINLDERTDRRAHMEKVLSLHPLFEEWKPTRFPALKPNITCYAPEWSCGGRLGYVASRASHLKVIESAFLRGVDELMVLEDDIDPCPHLTDWVNWTLANLPEGWMGVQFGGRHDSPPSPIKPGLVRLWRFLECPFAIYSRAGMNRILSHVLRAPWEIFDQSLMRLYHDEPHFYAPDLLPVGQILSPSENDPWNGQQRLSKHWVLWEPPPADCPPELAPAFRVAGSMQKGELFQLFEWGKQYGNVVEIGAFKGRSTLAFLAAGANVVSVDWGRDGWGPSVMKNWLSVNLQQHKDRHRLIQRSSHDPGTLAHILKKMPEPRCVFIDGDHSAEGVYHDLNLARALMPNGGLVCGHDYGKNDAEDECPGVQKAVDGVFGGRVVRHANTLWSAVLPPT